MFFKKTVAAIALSSLAATVLPAETSYAQQAAKSGTSAYVERSAENAYKSDYFDLKLKLPDGWKVASEAEAYKILNIGSEMVAGDNEDMQRDMDASVAKSLPIFFASRHPMSSQNPDNINVSSIAENVAQFPYVKRGKQYFDNMRLIAKDSATTMNYSEGYGSAVIDGVSFDTMTAEIPLNGVTVKQQYYAARIGDHIVTIITTYIKDQDKFLLDGIISAIEFE